MFETERYQDLGTTSTANAQTGIHAPELKRRSPRSSLRKSALHCLEEEQDLGAGSELEREDELDDNAEETDEECNDGRKDTANELEHN